MRTSWTGTLILAAVVLAATADVVDAGPTICKSTDSQGNVTYSDCPPKGSVPPPPPLTPPAPAEGPAAKAGPPKPGAPDTKTVGATRTPATVRPSSALAARLPAGWTEKRGNLVAGVPLVILGVLLSLGGSIGYVVEAFRVKWWWGLGCLFFAPASLAFLVVHWRVARKPFLISLVGAIVAIVGVVVIGVPLDALTRVPLDALNRVPLRR